MMVEEDYSSFIPKDVLEEVLEAEREVLKELRRLKRKKPYPSSRDVAEAIVEAVRTFSGHPNEFPEHVLRLLEEKGFDVRHVTIRRIWRLYENLVRRKVIADRLGVLAG